MELVEGEDLADRLKRSPIAIDEALEEAHEHESVAPPPQTPRGSFSKGMVPWVVAALAVAGMIGMGLRPGARRPREPPALTTFGILMPEDHFLVKRQVNGSKPGEILVLDGWDTADPSRGTSR